MNKKLTPLMEQYWSIKNEHPDKILLFRMGDFFEMFDKDAEVAAPVVGITLTYRNKKSGDDTRMCGVPHHSISGPIAKLLAQGFKVAICDQIEDPKLAKGLVKRAVTRILTPGLVYDPDTLNEIEAHYLASFDARHLAFLDTVTGEAFYYRSSDRAERDALLKLMSPKELLISKQQADEEDWASQKLGGVHLSQFDAEVGALDCKKLNFEVHEIESVARIQSYLFKMQGELGLLTQIIFKERSLSSHLELPQTTIAHLELFQSSEGKREGSLFHAINRTRTSAGARKLRSWLQLPLRSEGEIARRQLRLSAWRDRPNELKLVRQRLSALGDLERRLTRLGQPSSEPRDLWSLAEVAREAVQVSEAYADLNKELLLGVDRQVQEVFNVFDGEQVLVAKEGGFVRRGQNADLDYWIELAENSQKKISEFEQRERDVTSISSLKVRYNSVFGYYIEVTKTHLEKIPTHYLRKQTLVNAERFTTEELQELETRVLSSRSRRLELEKQVFIAYRQKMLSLSAQIRQIAECLSELDVLTGLAWLSIEQNYTQPRFRSDRQLRLLQCRHPVIEQMNEGDFVPNDLIFSESDCLLLTGPNMAGKSTLMRQLVLSVILAQIGSFVPAADAELPLFDRIFTRIGANDSLSKGLSTFMVEMVETAQILAKADNMSLVVVDEIGRGTSTYDGMALAQSILEYLLTSSQSLVLFATHFHELTDLSQQYPQLKNGHMKILETEEGLKFLHLFREGPAERSYGIQVAGLAGLPHEVIRRASDLLGQLEEKRASRAPREQGDLLDFARQRNSLSQMPSKEDRRKEKLLDELKRVCLNELTPLQVLNRVAQWQQELS